MTANSEIEPTVETPRRAPPTAVFALLCLSVCLLVFPWTLAKPGWPLALEANEPANYLASLSLARDFDLRCERSDLSRLHHEFPTFDSGEPRQRHR